MRTEDYDLIVKVSEKPIEEFIEESTNTTGIPAQKGKEFKLYIFNNDDRRVLAVPLIDGLSVMDGKPGSIHSNGYVLEPHKGGAIAGWRIDSETVATFIFDSASKSLALVAKKDNRDIGIIQCAIYPEKRYPKSRPKYVPPKPADTTASSIDARLPRYGIRETEVQYSIRQAGDFGGGFYRSVEPPTPQKNASRFMGSQQEENESLAVGFGAAKAHRVTKVSFTKEGKSPLCVLSIRYESPINLAKRSQSIASKAEYCDHWFKCGVKAMMTNCVDEAITAFTRVVKVSPDVDKAWEALMSAYESTDNFEQLVNATTNLVRLRYKDGDLWRKLGMLCVKRELWAEAIEAFDKYNALEPGKHDSWHGLGMGLAKTGQLDEAWYCCTKALQIDPKSSDAWDTLGLVHLQARRMDAALEAFSKSVALNPKNEEALSNLWTTCNKMNRTEDASLALALLREVNPMLANKIHSLV